MVARRLCRRTDGDLDDQCGCAEKDRRLRAHPRRPLYPAARGKVLGAADCDPRHDQCDLRVLYRTRAARHQVHDRLLLHLSHGLRPPRLRGTQCRERRRRRCLYGGAWHHARTLLLAGRLRLRKDGAAPCGRSLGLGALYAACHGRLHARGVVLARSARPDRLCAGVYHLCGDGGGISGSHGDCGLRHHLHRVLRPAHARACALRPEGGALCEVPR